MSTDRKSIAAIWPWQKEVYLHLQYVPWIAMDRIETEGALKEATALAENFVVHRPYHQDAETWKGLAIRAVGGNRAHTEWRREGDPEYANTGVLESCPHTRRILENLTDLDQCERVRFLWLAPGGEIHVHSDNPGRAVSIAFSVALSMPEGCEFWVDLNPDGSRNAYSHRIPIRPGTPFLFNNSTYHRLVNASSEPRVFLHIEGPLRVTDREWLEMAVRQNGKFATRDLVNRIVRKNLELGRELPKDSVLHCDWVNNGLQEDFYPADWAWAVMGSSRATPDFNREASLVTLAGTNPVPVDAIETEGLDSWLAEKYEAGRNVAVVIGAGTQILDSFGFAAELVRTVSRLRSGPAASVGSIQGAPFFILDLKAWSENGRPTPASFESDALPESLLSQTDFFSPDRGRENNPDYLRIRARVDRFLQSFNDKIYVYNTEPLRIEDFAFEPNLLIAPCAGFKPFALIRQFGLRHRDSRLIFADNNEKSLAYFRELLGCDSIRQIVDLQASVLAGTGTLPADAQGYLKKLLDSVIAEAFDGNVSEFMRCLRFSRRAELMKIDFVRETERLLAMITPQDRLLFWHSNVWSYTPVLFERTISESRERYSSFLAELARVWDRPAYLHPHGFRSLVGGGLEDLNAVLTTGGTRLGAPRLSSYRLFEGLSAGSELAASRISL